MGFEGNLSLPDISSCLFREDQANGCKWVGSIISRPSLFVEVNETGGGEPPTPGLSKWLSPWCVFHKNGRLAHEIRLTSCFTFTHSLLKRRSLFPYNGTFRSPQTLFPYGDFPTPRLKRHYFRAPFTRYAGPRKLGIHGSIFRYPYASTLFVRL